MISRDDREFSFINFWPFSGCLQFYLYQPNDQFRVIHTKISHFSWLHAFQFGRSLFLWRETCSTKRAWCCNFFFCIKCFFCSKLIDGGNRGRGFRANLLETFAKVPNRCIHLEFIQKWCSLHEFSLKKNVLSLNPISTGGGGGRIDPQLFKSLIRRKIFQETQYKTPL